jgi:TusA-related sulfurtransferase
MKITGNVISGQVTGDLAKQLSVRFEKIIQDRASYYVSRTDTSISHSKQLETAIPPSKISALSSGEFIVIVSDDPDQKIKLKTFHSIIINDHAALKAEQEAYKEIPGVRKLDNDIIQHNYLQIKQEAQELIQAKIERVLGEPGLQHLVIKK